MIIRDRAPLRLGAVQSSVQEFERAKSDIAELQRHNSDQDKEIIRNTAHMADIDRRLDVFSRFVEKLDTEGRDAALRRNAERRQQLDDARRIIEDLRHTGNGTATTIIQPQPSKEK